MTKEKLKKILKFTGIGLVIILILIQFIPVSRDNPVVTQEVQWDSAGTRALTQSACYDCHSNETVWPWYSYVAPASWLITHHVEDGRRHLNFSEWDQPNEGEREIARSITSGNMPLWDYLLLHPEAKLAEAKTKT